MTSQPSVEQPSGSGSPELVLGMAAGLLLLFVVVVAALLKRVRRQREELATTTDAKSVSVGPGAAANVSAMPEPPNVATESDNAEDDLTRMRAFSKDMLPNLAMSDDEDEDAVSPIEQSKAELRFGDASIANADEPTGVRELFVTEMAAKSDVGKRRKRNEDAVLADPSLDLYVVCDGMGGYAGGDVAAATAAEEVKKAVLEGEATPVGPVPDKTPPKGKQLVRAVERANSAVWNRSSKDPTLTGMGTTIVTALFHRRKNRVYVAHVGDSRVYRYRAGKLSQLTVDHTLGAKGVVGPLASSVRRAVGTQPDVKVDVVVDKPEPHDLYVLCTDGVYGMVAQDKLTRLLEEKNTTDWRKPVLDQLADELIAAANEAGGRDNATVLLVGIEAPNGADVRA